MKTVNLGRDIDPRDCFCDHCGYPFDAGDNAYAVPDEWGNLYCSKRCVAACMESMKSDMTGSFPE